MSIASYFRARHAELDYPQAAVPDLLQESAQRAEVAHVALITALSGSTAPVDVNVPREGSRTIGWPDPYGPDPIVFGPGPAC